MAPPPKSPRTGKGEEAGRGRKREPEDGVWGIPGGAQAKGQEPEAKRKATKTCTVHPKKVLQPNKERALCGSKHATWELSIERHDAVSSGNQKIPRRTVATVGMQTPCPVFAKITLLRLRGNRGAHFDEGKPYLCFAPPTFNVVQVIGFAHGFFGVVKKTLLLVLYDARSAVFFTTLKSARGESYR